MRHALLGLCAASAGLLGALMISACFLPAFDAAERASGAAGAGGDGLGGGGNEGGTSQSCAEHTDCEGPDGPCGTTLCASSQCVVVAEPAGTTPPALQAAGDCTEIQCNGRGETMEVADPDDLPDDGNICTLDGCSGTDTTFTPTNEGEVCGASPDVVCDDGQCVGCRGPADCPRPPVCHTAACVGRVCVPEAIADGTECGASECESDSPDGEQIDHVCAAGECEALGVSCDQHACDTATGECKTMCNAAADCQAGAVCQSFDCEDCTTCGELLLGAPLTSLCPGTAAKLSALEACACGAGCDPACGPNFCAGLAIAAQCNSCLGAAMLCDAEYDVCAADADVE